ncbi:VOC family protein [Pseudomonas gingeri]|uniref:VOC family protein n=1 Tax=Pseudomonas gingeri TaxID=117681 RepID=UPI00351C2F01
MTDPNYFMLYVESPAVSVDFYRRLLGKEPLIDTSDFALFALDSGIKLGLWATRVVTPTVPHTGGGGEMAFNVGENAIVDEIHEAWRELGVPIVQTPSALGFGYAFVAVDPDAHRLRVYSLAPALR